MTTDLRNFNSDKTDLRKSSYGDRKEGVKRNIFQKHYLDAVFKQYCSWEGRATRKEFWVFVIFNFITLCCLGFVGGLFCNVFGVVVDETISIFIAVAVLLTWPPSIGIMIRRFHDVGLPGVWAVICFFLLPFVGGLICLIGSKPDNKYGPNRLA